MTEAGIIATLREQRVTGQDWAPVLIGLLGLGVVAVAIYGGRSGWGTAVSAILLSQACVLVGMLLGFLFGIPRALQAASPPAKPGTADAVTEAQRGGQYSANTNLEQISDWLTKILVGVGLTQLTTLPSQLQMAGHYFGPLLGGDGNDPVAAALLVFFSVGGFLASYLWTRLFLGREFVRADAAFDLEDYAAASDAQEQKDARALGLLSQYLSAEDVSKVSVGELKQDIAGASPTVKVQIFNQAKALRSKSWDEPDQKYLVDRTIPVFQALCDADTENRFHQNHGQLGYALKDQRKPDYAAAEAELSRAIGIRGPAASNGFELYEFNRAICRILLDPQYAAGGASTPDNREQIMADLKVAIAAIPDLKAQADIAKWIPLNNAADSLKLASPPAASGG
ncbi:MAG: hypothetical protein P4M09_27690 [Devosia sp.]|nr:hypothetical protein [Devosia sp.]